MRLRLPFFNAPAEAVIDLSVNPASAGLPSEYERLTAELEPLLVNVKVSGKRSPGLIERLAQLQSADLDFLTKETGLARVILAELAAAASLEIKADKSGVKLPAALFYGLICEGLAADLGALGLISLANLQAALAGVFR